MHMVIVAVSMLMGRAIHFREFSVHKCFDCRINVHSCFRIEDCLTLVLVLEGKGNVLTGVVVLRFVPDRNNPRSIVVEMLSRNQLQGMHNSGVGAEMIRIVEDYIAKPLGCSEIVIEAVEDLTDYYSSLGYSSTGKEEYDDFWGKVVYMKKIVSQE